MKEHKEKIKFYYKELPVQINDIVTPCLELHFKTSFKNIISKEITEEIGREILNNSKVIMKGKQPFLSPISEENGQCDNYGNNYSIDTKLIYMQSTCHQISKDEQVVRKNNRDYDFLYNFMSAYERYKRSLKPKSEFQKRQYEVIKKLYDMFHKYNKNLLLIYPIPQLDIMFMRDLDFSKNITSGFFWGLSQIKKDCKFKYDVYFAYPLFNNDYNLVKIGIKGFTCEPFISCESQKKYLESIRIGMTLKNIFYPLIAEWTVEDGYSFNFRYK